MGIILGLACGLTWSCAVILFKKCEAYLHPLPFNLVKNAVALLAMIPTFLIIEGTKTTFPTTQELWLLILSGALGIGLADCLFLLGLKYIGATRTAIIDCLYSPYVIVLSYWFLGERLHAQSIIGIACILSAIFLVTKFKDETPLSRRTLFVGLSFSAIAILCMASGILIVKPLFSSVSLFLIITIRLAAGFLVSLAWVLFHPERSHFLRNIYTVQNKSLLISASLVGTYISMMFWVASFKYAQASIAAVLNQMSTIFTVILAIIFLGEPFTKRVLLATALATGGVLLISVG